MSLDAGPTAAPVDVKVDSVPASGDAAPVTTPPVVDKTATEMPKQDGKSLVESETTEAAPAGDAATAPATMGEDWREKIAGEDGKLLAHLKRYKTFESFAKAGWEAQQKIRSGDYSRNLPDNATPEQIAAWRKEAGLPESEADYALDLNGIVPAEADQPLLDNFKSFSFKNNLPPKLANNMVSWFFEQQERAQIAQQYADDESKINAGIELKGEWKDNYTPYMNKVRNFLAKTFPEGMGDLILGARMADGSLVGSNPKAIKGLLAAAHESIKDAPVMPSGSQKASAASELEQIQALMRTDYQKYRSDERMVARHRELLEAQTRMRAA